MTMFAEVKILFPFLIGIVLLSAIAARPSPQETEHVHKLPRTSSTHVHKIGGGGGGGGDSSSGNGGGGGGNGQIHVHHTGGQTVTHVHHTKGDTKTNVHHFGGGAGGAGGGDGDTAGDAKLGPGVNTVPHEGQVGGLKDVVAGQNTVPHEVDADTSSILIQDPAKYGSLINNGSSFIERTDVRRRNICNRGLIDKTATKLRTGLHKGVDQLEAGIKKLTKGGHILGPIGALVYDAGKGVRNLANNAVDGVDFGIQDAACGLGNIADDVASGLGKGNLFSNAGDAVKEFFAGLGNIAIDVASEAGEGVGRAASNIKSFASKLDGKQKTKYRRSSP